MSLIEPFVIGDLEIHLGARRLIRSGAAVHISHKAFTLLEVLIRARPKALSKAELQTLIWPETFVVEANLANLVGELRRALGDDSARPRLLRTVHGFGYAWDGRFNEPAAPAQSSPYRCLFLGRTPFMLPAGEYILGRGPESVVPLHSDVVSRRHARLVLDARQAVLTDLGSRNGTFVRGRRIEQPVTLGPLDEIRIGPFYLTLTVPHPEGPTTSEPLRLPHGA